jgi:hypothetical protein
LFIELSGNAINHGEHGEKTEGKLRRSIGVAIAMVFVLAVHAVFAVVKTNF